MLDQHYFFSTTILRLRFQTEPLPTGIEENLLRAVEPFGVKAAFSTGVEEFVRLDDGFGFLRVLDAGEITQPGLLSHRINIDLLAVQALNHIRRARKIRARQPSRTIHLSVYRL